MPTQTEIAAHLDLSQAEVSRLMAELGMDWKVTALDTIRTAYIRRLRGAAAGHRTDDGQDLIRERVLNERVDRELKELTLAEKRQQLVNVSQLEPALVQMVVAFRTEVQQLPDKIKADIDALHGTDVDLQLLTDHINAALEQLARYDPEHAGTGAPIGEADGPTAEDDHDGVGTPAAPAEPEEHGQAGALQP